LPSFPWLAPSLVLYIFQVTWKTACLTRRYTYFSEPLFRSYLQLRHLFRTFMQYIVTRKNHPLSVVLEVTLNSTSCSSARLSQLADPSYIFISTLIIEVRSRILFSL
jgi:hypothetical protein